MKIICWLVIIFLIDIRLRFGKEEDRLESGFFDRGNIYWRSL